MSFLFIKIKVNDFSLLTEGGATSKTRLILYFGGRGIYSKAPFFLMIATFLN